MRVTRYFFLFSLILSLAAGLVAPAPAPAQNAPAPRPGAPEEKKVPPRLSVTRNGGTGLFRLVSGYTPDQGGFAVGTGMQYWQQNDFLAPNFFHRHLETYGNITISTADWMELYIAGLTTSHQYRDELIMGRPTLVQANGDLQIGTKFGFETNEFFFLGGDLWLRFNTKQGNIGPEFSATSFGIRTLPTFDFTVLPDPFPLRILLNAGYFRDNAGNVLETSGGSEHQMFALGIPPDDDVWVGGLGIEIPQNFLSIILEYTTEQYSDLNGYYIGEKRRWNTSPQRLTPGLRFFPVGGLVIDLYADLGAGLLGMTDGVVPEQSLTDTREEIMPDWTANLGIAYNFTPPPPPAPKEGKIRGLVFDAKTGLPLADTIVSFPGQNVTDLITDSQGRFTSYAFPLGDVTVSARKENYKPAQGAVAIQAGREVAINFKLEPIEKVGVFTGVVVDDKNKPVLASLSFEGTNLPNVATDPLSGKFEARMTPDTYTVKVVANGFNPQTKRIRVVDKRTTRVNFRLEPIQRFGTLMGKLETRDGRPVAGVISFNNPKVRPIAANPETGQFEDKVEPGTYQVKAMAQGYEPAVTNIAIVSGRTTLANFVLNPVVTAGTLRGVVVDAKTGQGVYAVISSPNGEFSNIVADPESGAFVQKLPAGEYAVKAAAPNYKADTKQVRIANGQTTDVRFELQGFDKIQITKENIEIKEKIRFATGKATILFDSYPLLDEIAQAIKDSPSMQVVIEGHTDSSGADAYNLKLSQQRAQAVKDYLAARGIESERLKAQGYGEERPIAPNDTEEGREKNRRVEFNIIAQ